MNLIKANSCTPYSRAAIAAGLFIGLSVNPVLSKDIKDAPSSKEVVKPIIKKDYKKLDLVCSEHFKTDRIQKLLTMETKSEIITSPIRKGLALYTQKLKKRNSDQTRNIINNDWSFRILKVNGQQAFVFDRNHEIIEELLISDVGLSRANKPLDYRRALKNKKLARYIDPAINSSKLEGPISSSSAGRLNIVTHIFTSNDDPSKVVNFQPNHKKGPHLLISRQLAGSGSTKYSTKAYACVKRMK